MGGVLTVVDLFCGAGGLSRGFQMAGFEVALGLDNFEPAAETFQRNFPKASVIVEDVKEVRSEDILRELGGRPDVVIGGPPCEPFTRTNPRREAEPLDRLYKDPIGRLVLHFIRIVGDLQPRVFVMENVPGIMEGGLKDAIRAEFARVGYPNVRFNVLRAELYGTPSVRTRVFVSNLRLRPKPLGRLVRVIDAIGDLPDPRGVHDIPNHEYVPLPRRKLRRIAKLRWGEALVRYRGSGGRIYGNLIRLHPFKPAPTVMGSSRFIHPFDDRLLTVREHARLMGFPDDHVFLGGRDVQYNQVGEAVPVPLAYHIAKYIASRLGQEG
ncbi:MAG: DNA (cytosine-5-)-methyltransferase [Thermoprotei archaeon]|nr:MAG: DNA (cytosine-5-)-methyltransferase [Thermoprotei archaeon]